MIYDPITRQQVEVIGQYRPQQHRFRFGRKEQAKPGEAFVFVRVRYGDYVTDYFRERAGGFKLGEERDVEPNSLVADDGIREICKAVEVAPVVS